MRFFAPAALVLSLTATSALAFDIDSLSEAERSAFRDEVRAYLLDNPEVIMEAVAILEQRREAQQANNDLALVADNKDRLFNDGYSWEGGNPDGDITLVEFIDYRCGYCRKAHDEVAELIETDGNIRFIVKEYPILGEASEQSARYAIAVKQLLGAESYKLAHDALIKMRGDVTAKSLTKLSKGLGFDAEALLAHMNSHEVTTEIRTTRALALDMGITGTPSFVMEDEMLRGYLPLEGMRAIVEEKRG
ncbi:thioredoxin domain-containing protein [Shimia sp. R11_0]|uniref:DsbA family protein n=1 Tax=Shimia sp. R11_0 TaxID=2821096 RepID=UPI001ADA60B7|nr:DsbA family protein [Shimia sp. R11_0]MBO9477502.1 thioredoxin domain-containing protein [Shimia sp. R11_0]